MANTVISLGGSPVCADCSEEVKEVTEKAACLLLNMGTPNKDSLESMIRAGKTANKKGIPVILDPVGIGLSKFRQEIFLKLIKEIKVTCIRGNYGEVDYIYNLLEGGNLNSYNEKNNLGGIDSGLTNFDLEKISFLSKRLSCILIATGKVDYIAGKGRLSKVLGGSPMLKTFTGSGCILDSIISVFLAKAYMENKELTAHQKLACLEKALKFYKSSSEISQKELEQKNIPLGPYSFKNCFLDDLDILAKKEELNNKRIFNPSFYAIISQANFKNRNLEEGLEEILRAGVSLVQLREKNISTRDYIDLALRVKKVCHKYNIPLIINDSLDVCLAIDADGLHLGQKDMEIKTATKILGDDKIIGATAHSLEESQKAMISGADYLGIGAAFSTNSKNDAVKLKDLKIYKDITSSLDLPVVAIGGINLDNMDKLKNLGLSGLALISALFSQEDLYENAKKINKKIKDIIGEKNG